MPPATAPICPRCGYDQSGVVTTWSSAALCPLRGRCTECGLAFDWCDILNPRLTVPRWSFEHALSLSPFKAAATWARAFRPARFWLALRMEHPIIRPRLILFAAAMLLITHFGLGAMAAYGTYHSFTSMRNVRGGLYGPVPWGTVLAALLWPYRPRGWNTFLPASHWMTLAAVWIALCPLGYFALDQTFHRMKCRRVHLLRIWAFSFSIIPVLALATGANRLAGMLIGWGGSLWSIVFWVHRTEWLFPLIAGAWAMVFWGRATRRYLKFPHAAAVAIVMAVVALLTALAIVSYWPGSGLLWDLGRLLL